MLQTEINPIPRRRSSNKLGKESYSQGMTLKAAGSASRQHSLTEVGQKHAYASATHHYISLKSRHFSIAEIQGKDEHKPPSLPVRRISRSRSCLSSRSLRASLEELQVPEKPKRRVSFGAVKGLTVENLSLDNKNAMWFSRAEYTSMRQEVFEIVKATRKNGTLEESSEFTSRGLENAITMDESAPQIARICILEHNDLAMYALASRRAVRKAQQIAEKDAIEANTIQKENGLNRHQHFDSFKKERSASRLPRQRSGSTLMVRP